MFHTVGSSSSAFKGSVVKYCDVPNQVNGSNLVRRFSIMASLFSSGMGMQFHVADW